MDLTAPFSALFTFLTNILKWSLDGVKWTFDKVLYLPFDGLLTSISAIFTALDFSTFASTYALNWAGLPPQMIWFINAVAIPQGLVMLGSAIGLRMLINLIPAEFTRL